MMIRGIITLVGLAVLALPHAEAVGVATASVDLGNEWLKIGLVKPGVPMDIVLNQESKRKTRVVIGLRNHERTFSDPGMNVATKYPKYAFTYLTELLGVQVDSDIVRAYQIRFPIHNIEPHPERGTVVFRLAEDESYTVEELMAQILGHAIQNAATFAEQEIMGIVVTVPPYFNQAQRKAVLLVGQIAKIKIMQLLNANTAVGINYGVFRAKTFNKTATNILFYDMGATSTVATVASYTTVKEKSQTSKDRTPQLEIAGIGYDRTLGGNSWDLRLRTHLLAEFMKNKKVKGRDVSSDPRAMEKLAQSAEKVKRVLSANKETKAQVEGLYDEIDFKTKVSRDTFYKMTSDLFERVAQPIDDALALANLTRTDIDQLIIFGGGVRIPKIQEILEKTMGVDQLGKSINGDEAACLGASYRAAVLSKAFRVSKFLIKDINLYPIQMNYDKLKDGEIKTYTEKIFPRNHPTNKPKILLFNRSNEDFHFELNYGDLSFLTPLESTSFGKTQLSAHNLTNLSATVEGHSNDTRKGVRVKFAIDDSGIAELVSAEVVYEREPIPEPVEKSTLESISDFFFGGADGDNSTNGTNATVDGNATTADADANATKKDDENTTTTEDETPKKVVEKKDDDEADEKTKVDEGTESDEKTDKTEDEKKDDDEDEETTESSDSKDTGDANATAGDVNDTDTDTNTTGEEAKEPEKVKMIKIIERVPFSVVYRDIPGASDDFITDAQSRIQTLLDAETERTAREAAYNTIEGGIYTARDQLSQVDFEAVSTEEQREAMSKNLTELGDWLEEAGWEANSSVLNTQFKVLEQTLRSVRFRAAEAIARPAAIATLRDVLNNTDIFYARLLNYSQNLKENATAWHSEKELDELKALYNDTLAWLYAKEEAQNAIASHEAPAVFSRHITDKIDKLNRENSHLARRPKPRPKKKKVPKIITNSTNSSDNIIIDGDNMTIDLDGTNETAANVTASGDEDTVVADDTVETVPAPDMTDDVDAKADATDDAKASKKTARKEEKKAKKEKKEKKEKKTKKEKKVKKDKKSKSKSKSGEDDEDKDEL